MTDLTLLENEELKEIVLDELFINDDFNIKFQSWAEVQVEETEIENFKNIYDANFNNLSIESDGGYIEIDFDTVEVHNILNLVLDYENVFEKELDLSIDINDIYSITYDHYFKELSVDTDEELSESDIEELTELMNTFISDLIELVNENVDYFLSYYDNYALMLLIENEGWDIEVDEEEEECTIYVNL